MRHRVRHGLNAETLITAHRIVKTSLARSRAAGFNSWGVLRATWVQAVIHAELMLTRLEQEVSLKTSSPLPCPIVNHVIRVDGYVREMYEWQ